MSMGIDRGTIVLKQGVACESNMSRSVSTQAVRDVLYALCTHTTREAQSRVPLGKHMTKPTKLAEGVYKQTFHLAIVAHQSRPFAAAPRS